MGMLRGSRLFALEMCIVGCTEQYMNHWLYSNVNNVIKVPMLKKSNKYDAETTA